MNGRAWRTKLPTHERQSLGDQAPYLSGQDVLHHMPVDVGEAEVAAGVAVGELLMVQAEDVEDGGVEVVDVDFVLLGEVAVVVGGAVGDAALHAAAGHPHGEAFGVVIASVAALGGGGAAELATPDDEGVFEEAA